MEEILAGIQKPARYIGCEWNVSKKDFDAAEVKFALCFPDLYEVGMSNLGIRIIYGLLNRIPYVSCERFFSCARDMEERLYSSGRKLCSLESHRGLDEFDLVGFSVGYELGYTNLLGILKLGGLPLRAAARGSAHPLVIAGGPSVLNPEPLHEFVDLFVIGEAEEALPELIEAFRGFKAALRSGKISKEEALIRLSAIEGVYAPSLYEVAYDDSGRISYFRPRLEGLPLKVKKRFVSDLDAAYYPVEWLVPYIQIVHDRISLEIARGCPNRCRFCQARSQYYPLRQRRPEEVIRLADQLYKTTGYEELALAGLSVSDYPGIEQLLSHLVAMFRKKGVSVSLPSVKSKDLVGNLSALIATIKKTGLTFAPEAASEKLRQALNKDFDVREFFGALEQSFRAGYQRVKLYFMICLPGEERQDLDAIIDFSCAVSDLRRKTGKGPAEVNVSINALIPKAHTAFQWMAMPGVAQIEERQAYLRKRLKNRRVKLNFHSARMSFMEGVLCRGDRRLSRVILEAFEKGARFDAWQDTFDFERWMEAFRSSALEPALYARARAREEILPWDFIDIGIPPETLVAESAPEEII